MTPSTLELKQLLECSIGPVASIDRKLSVYSSSYPIEELDVHLCAGATVPMMFKNLSRDALLEKARVKPGWLHSPAREIEIYRSVLSRFALGTAQVFTSVSEPDRYWLFLERIDGAHLWQMGDMAVWHNAARWLACLHRQPVSFPQLTRLDRAYYVETWERALALHPELAPITKVYEGAVDCLLAAPLSLIHGEFYASNVLIAGERICPVDWELAAIGPGLIDLAALTAGKWTLQDRREFVAAYYGDSQPSAAMMAGLDCARLYLTVRLLGWASGWTPPAAHRRNWLQEALETAERLE